MNRWLLETSGGISLALSRNRLGCRRWRINAMIKDYQLVISEASGTSHKLRQQSKDREQNEEKWRDSNISNDQVPHLEHGFRFSFQGRTLLRHLRGRQDFLSHGLLFLHRTRMKKARDRDTWLCQSKITVDSYKNMWICQQLYMRQSLMGGTWIACGVPRDTEIHTTSPWVAQGPHHSKHGLTLKTPYSF